ncbi:MAG TPA: hypothetical protein VND23_08075 [Acidimicrobiales bacterium]|nr:hypothetical protein [Acidimicrobiales bacterium]
MTAAVEGSPRCEVPLRIAVIHHPRSMLPMALYEKVRAAAELIFVLDDECATDPTALRVLGRFGTTVDVSGLDPEAAAYRIAEHRPDGVVAVIDELLERAAAIAALLGLPYHSPHTANALADKRLQREVLRRAGVAGPRFAPLVAGLSRGRAAELARTVGVPAVLKPARGAGSRGMRLVGGTDDLLAQLRGEPDGSAYVLEEYLADDPEIDARFGSYVSVESVVSAGTLSHAGITGRLPIADHFRETGTFAPAALSATGEAAVLRLVEDALRALEVTDAVVNTEVKLTPTGPRIVEVNGRLGGRGPFVVQRASGVNLFEIACRVAAGVPVRLDGLAPCDGVAYIVMVQPPEHARRVVSVDGLEALTSIEGVEAVRLDRAPGDPVDWRDGTEAHVLVVRGRAADHSALLSSAAAIERDVRFSYEEEPRATP